MNFVITHTLITLLFPSKNYSLICTSILLILSNNFPLLLIVSIPSFSGSAYNLCYCARCSLDPFSRLCMTIYIIHVIYTPPLSYICQYIFSCIYCVRCAWVRKVQEFPTLTLLLVFHREYIDRLKSIFLMDRSAS